MAVLASRRVVEVDVGIPSLVTSVEAAMPKPTAAAIAIRKRCRFLVSLMT